MFRILSVAETENYFVTHLGAYIKADYISQGSVATRSKCGEIFIDHLIANLLRSISLKN